jgi:cellulose synthase/poly-beta-1,6-N-acetylglucosamine synthase-like glycosyltransferase
MWSAQRQECKGQKRPLGISVAICTYNGESRLPATLSHLKRQRTEKGIPWEVLLIDNASTDNSAELTRQYWSNDGPVPLRILREARLGLSFARSRAFEEARHEIVTFVDDDNWVAPGWISTASECMSEDASLGALCSSNRAVADVPFPNWFSRWANYYAAHASCESSALENWLLIGAGMTIRTQCWQELRRDGFQPQLTDRVGAGLTTCGDLELGCAIQLAGWKIRVEPRLKLQHYMPPARLDWNYLRRLARKTGEAMALLDCYFVMPTQEGLKRHLRHRWWVRLISESCQIARQYPLGRILKSRLRTMEGEDDIVFLEQQIGRLTGFLRLRSQYTRLRREIARSAWCRTTLRPGNDKRYS